MEQKLYDAASKLPETGLDFHTIHPTSKPKSSNRTWRAIASAAACFILLISIGFITVEAKEYNDAIRFFNEYGLSTDGLSRGEIKAVYRDITTKSFTYSKTAEVIANSLSSGQTEGYEILQDNPTPKDVENLWDYMKNKGGLVRPSQHGIHYEYRSEYKEDAQLGFEVHNKSFIEKYDGERLLWSVSISEFRINGFSTVSDGVIAYGEKSTYDSAQNSCAWMAKIDLDGNLLWKHLLFNGFEDEYICAIVENEDGSYAVFSRGDLKYFCLSQFTSDGKETYFKQTEVGNRGIWNAARLGDGYIVQLGSHMTNGCSNIVKVDQEGNITESFSYGDEDSYYYINDMIEYNGNIYLSGYSVPKLAHQDQSPGRRNEIGAILRYVNDNDRDISSEELTSVVRDNYTAMLLVCDPTTGTPHEFYSVKGSLGGELSLSHSGMLLWNVESITTTFYAPTINAFTIGGTSYVFRYTFDSNGGLVSQEKTGEIANYLR